MQVLSPVRTHRSALACGLALVLLAGACSGGVRPTLTGDRLDESAIATNDIGQQAAEAIQPSDTTDQVGTTEEATPEATGAQNAAMDDAAAVELAPGEVQRLVVEVLETFPHDASAFTQGLELHNGFLFESTGSRGPGNILLDSTLRRVDPATGQIAQSISIEQPYFAEGLTRVGDQLIQLTWKSEIAFYWDAETFELEKTVAYTGQGWGICHDGSQLIMTNGTPTLTLRDPTTFEARSQVPVTLNGEPIDNLNEVECVNGAVWANIWQTQQIVRIDPSTGNVTAVVDASSLDGLAEESSAVLNGIAWDEASGSFFITGKLWPTMYRVNFVPDTSS